MPDQMEFDFGSARTPAQPPLPVREDEKGYERWTYEQRAAIRELEHRFGVVLNRRVRLRLNCWDDDLVGRLVLADLLPPMRKGDPLRLRIGRATFDHTEIEMCIVLAG